MSYAITLSPAVSRALAGAMATGLVTVGQPSVLTSLERRGFAVRMSPKVGQLTDAGRREADALAGRVSR